MVWKKLMVAKAFFFSDKSRVNKKKKSQLSMWKVFIDKLKSKVNGEHKWELVRTC